MEKSLNEQVAEFQAKKAQEALRARLEAELESFIAKQHRYAIAQHSSAEELAEDEQVAKEVRESLAAKDAAWLQKHQHADGRELYQVL